MTYNKPPRTTRNIKIWNIVAGVFLVLSLIALGITQFVLKHKPDVAKTKDLLVKVCTSSPSDKATIEEHSKQLLETHASDMLLWSLYAIALIVTVALNPIKDKFHGCLLCLVAMTLIIILSIEHSIVNVLKISIGEPRPYFLNVCKLPKEILESDDCVKTVKDFEGDIFKNLLEETKQGYCNSKVARSQPSGHSSTALALSTSTAIQLIILAIERFKHSRESKPSIIKFLIVTSSIILLVLFLAFQVMNGRVQEHFHTWGNCLSGMLIGMSISLVFSIPHALLHLRAAIF